MRRRNVSMKNLSLAAIVIAVCSLTLGYAALTQTLNINMGATVQSGQTTWNIYFTNSSTSPVTTGLAQVGNMSLTNTTVTISNSLLKVGGDSVTYYFKVKNDGDVDAMIDFITKNVPTASGGTEADQNLVLNSYEYLLQYTDGTGVQLNDTLKAKEEKEMKLTVSLKDDVNLPSSDIVVSNLGYTITYVEESSTGDSSDEEIVQARTIDAMYGSILANPNVETYSYMGGTYLKGNITNNYAWYNGFIWRIMGKNADGSIRLITEENVTAIPWGAKNTAQDYSNSYIKDWVNNYFLPRLKDTSKIVSTSFCEDSTGVTDSSSSRTTCSNPVLAQAGILSLDEYNLAGGSSSYLKNGQHYWTLTPYSASFAWNVFDSGNADYYGLQNARGVRAVISISSDTTITGGNGTLTTNSDTEYVLGQTLANVTGTLGSKTGSGEYVKFDGRLYRIVEHTGSGTKLILDGFYDRNVKYGSNFSTMSTLLTSSDFLNWLAPTRQADILNTTWYRGDYFIHGDDYKTNLASTSNPFTSKAGLIRVGEMLASQSLSLISSNYSKTNSTSNTKYYYTLTPYDASYAWSVFSDGIASSNSVTYARGVRAVIMVSSDMTITTGNGTLSRPYEV